jgi:hypothetical protein
MITGQSIESGQGSRLSRLNPFLRLHLLFAADDVAVIDTSTDLIYFYSKAADAAFINITLPHTLFGNLLDHFLLNHDIIL